MKYKAIISMTYPSTDKVDIRILTCEETITTIIKSISVFCFNDKAFLNIDVNTALMIEVKDLDLDHLGVHDVVSLSLAKEPFNVVGFDVPYKVLVEDFYPEGDEVYLNVLVKEDPLTIRHAIIVSLKYLEKQFHMVVMSDEKWLMNIMNLHECLVQIPDSRILSVIKAINDFHVPGFDEPEIAEVLKDIPELSDEELFNSPIFKKEEGKEK